MKKRCFAIIAFADFILWGRQAYPADRYGLIFWNHGGGTVLGFGADEHDPAGELMLAEMGQALDDGGVHMDFVGFDACLMATLEVAYMLSPYADYMIPPRRQSRVPAGIIRTGWRAQPCEGLRRG